MRRGVVAFGLWGLLTPAAAWAADYYVDDLSGDDGRVGTSESTAWRSLANVASHSFVAGDVVRFRSGGRWDAVSLGNLGLHVTQSGRDGSPITYTSYGTGPRPVITNSDLSTTWVRAMTIGASFVVVDGLHLADATEAGLAIQDGGQNNVVRACELSGSGMGIILTSEHNLVTDCHLHDLVMVNNTPGEPGTPEADDDYGAVAVGIMAANNEVAYSRMERCVGPSYDYGQDGGGVEFYTPDANTTIENVLVHHNWVADGEGFFEIGGQGGTVRNVAIYHNVSVNNRVLAALHNGGSNFTVTIEGLRFEHNTVVETEQSNWSVMWTASPPAAGTLRFRNNVVVLGTGYGQPFSSDGFTHEHNLYAFADPDTVLGVTPGVGESAGNPAFVAEADRDFHLLPASDAIDRGADLGYLLDFDDVAMPVGAAPDLGAFEYRPDPPAAGSGGAAGTGGYSGATSGGTTGAGAQGAAGISGGAAGIAGTAGSAADEPAANDSHGQGGCSCRMPRSAGRQSLMLAAGLALAGLLRRRRPHLPARSGQKISSLSSLV